MSDARFIDGISPGRAVEFYHDGQKLTGFEGEGIAAALMRHGILQSRISAQDHAPRGYYCGMGVCWECVVEIEGHGAVKACQFPVRAGLSVRTLAVRSPEKV